MRRALRTLGGCVRVAVCLGAGLHPVLAQSNQYLDIARDVKKAVDGNAHFIAVGDFDQTGCVGPVCRDAAVSVQNALKQVSAAFKVVTVNKQILDQIRAVIDLQNHSPDFKVTGVAIAGFQKADLLLLGRVRSLDKTRVKLILQLYSIGGTENMVQGELIQGREYTIPPRGRTPLWVALAAAVGAGVVCGTGHCSGHGPSPVQTQPPSAPGITVTFGQPSVGPR